MACIDNIIIDNIFNKNRGVIEFRNPVRKYLTSNSILTYGKIYNIDIIGGLIEFIGDDGLNYVFFSELNRINNFIPLEEWRDINLDKLGL